MGDQPDGHGPDGEPPKRSGPPRTELDQRQRAKLLDLIVQGKGIDQALRDPDIRATYRAYRNTAGADAEFRAEVASARRSASQALDEVGHLAAHSDNEVLVELWHRRDKARELNRARADRHRERREDLRRADRDRRDRLRREKADRLDRDKERALRLHLAKIAAAARAAELAARAGKGPKDESPIDPRNLTDEELADFERLMAKMQAVPI